MRHWFILMKDSFGVEGVQGGTRHISLKTHRSNNWQNLIKSSIDVISGADD